jgi:hypothetical protein
MQGFRPAASGDQRQVEAGEAYDRKLQALILMRAVCDQSLSCLADAPDADELELAAQVADLRIAVDARLAVLGRS